LPSSPSSASNQTESVRQQKYTRTNKHQPRITTPAASAHTREQTNSNHAHLRPPRTKLPRRPRRRLRQTKLSLATNTNNTT
jgi:hypothetical protein